MHTSVERLPDGSDWVAILYGPIVLASPAARTTWPVCLPTDGRMAHVAQGPMVPLDKVPVLLATAEELPAHVVPDPRPGRCTSGSRTWSNRPSPRASRWCRSSACTNGATRCTGNSQRRRIAARREKLAAEERARAAREAATLDWVAVGEQQPEVEHDFKGEGTETGIHNGRRWRHGA